MAEGEGTSTSVPVSIYFIYMKPFIYEAVNFPLYFYIYFLPYCHLTENLFFK